MLQVAHSGLQLRFLQKLCLDFCQPLFQPLGEFGKIGERLVVDLENVISQLLSGLEGVKLGFGGLRQSGELSYLRVYLFRVEFELLLHHLLKLAQLRAYACL